MKNFRDKPLQGNGFQVSLEMKYQRRQGMLSYLSAPIEKGVWTAAVLEEGGIVGFILFTGYVFDCFSSAQQAQGLYFSVCIFYHGVVELR